MCSHIAITDCTNWVIPSLAMTIHISNKINIQEVYYTDPVSDSIQITGCEEEFGWSCAACLAILAIFPAADFSAIPLAEKVKKASVSEYVLKI